MTALRFASGTLRVVAVGAHPDDIEIGCGGTLLQFAAQTTLRLNALVLTGDERRCQESLAASRWYGEATTIAFGGLPDTRLPAHWEAVKSTLHDFASATETPDLVFVPRTSDAHQDHALIGTLAASVWRGPQILHYEIPKWDGDLGSPNVYVPLDSETAHRKLDLLNTSFPSQHDRPWWDDEMFLGLMRLRGMECQSRYAEAFTSGKIVVSPADSGTPPAS